VSQGNALSTACTFQEKPLDEIDQKLASISLSLNRGV